MALRRKKRYETPVGCSICKEKRAYHTIHGFTGYGGRTCCNDCYPQIQQEHKRQMEKENNFEPSEADYQTWMRL
ncbi:hypothetical protein [Paenibacillus lentus]|uniref:Uncharacterized protein n=1 Tax=Paenibacillus lentus TaxID=1338368 RepID=A0A3Q8S396_9BACL|nr:hypothetical protein [Paenibacillus lentus]AZK44792.1 hypothetical protein EIM92_00110 [Paenibacillus lentus]